MIIEVMEFIERFVAIGFFVVGYYFTLEYVRKRWSFLGVNIMVVSTILLVILNHFLGV